MSSASISSLSPGDNGFIGESLGRILNKNRKYGNEKIICYTPGCEEAGKHIYLFDRYTTGLVTDL